VEKRWIESLRESREVTILSIGAPCRHVNQYFEIHGKADLIAQHALGTVVLYEVKATKGKTLTRDDPYCNHADQLQFYLNAMGIEQGIINYIDCDEFKRSGRLIDRRYPLNRDEKPYLDLLNRSHDLFEALDTDTIPPKKRCWKCSGFCSYKEVCESNFRNEKTI
jgi:CRISPR/Cas system-associated exonuclease Cas4 (RecB family)